MSINTSCAGCFAGLACAIRIEIINLLQEKGEMSVSEIAKHFKVTQPTITHHLQYLKEIRLLVSRKEKTRVFYSLDKPCGEVDCKVFS
jgi:DNA-binding transcriptional ArsR family regulator